MSDYYYEWGGDLNVVFHVERDGDRAVDVFSADEFEEMLRKYPSAVSKDFYEFVEAVQDAVD